MHYHASFVLFHSQNSKYFDILYAFFPINRGKFINSQNSPFLAHPVHYTNFLSFCYLSVKIKHKTPNGIHTSRELMDHQAIYRHLTVDSNLKK